MAPPTGPMIDPDAIKRLLMQGGDPSAMFSGDPSQPPSGPTPVPGDPNKPPMATAGLYPPTSTPSAPPQSAPPSGTLSAAATGSAPPSGSMSQSMPSFATPEEKQQYLSEHPPAVPARPVGDFDSGAHPTLRRILGSLFAGTAEFGGDLNHRPGQGAQFLDRWAGQDQAQRTYDKNQPRLTQEAGNQAYNQYLEQGAKAGEIEHTGAETTNLQQNNPAMARKAQFLGQLQEEAQKGAMPPDALRAKYLRMAQYNRVNASPDEINDIITNTKPVGSKYTLTRDPQTQAPIELVDRQGNHYSASNLPKDPEAQQMWNDATTASGQKEQVEEGKEKRVAGYAADRQAAGFQQAQTMEGRKAAAPYLADINDAKNQQQMMQDLLGGKMSPSAQTAAMFKLIGLEQPTGSHRIMPAEIEGVEKLGGLPDRIKQAVLGMGRGDHFSPDLIPDVLATAKTLTQNKVKTANDNLQSTYRNTGYKVGGSDANGRFDKPEDYAAPQNATAGQGAQHVPGGKAQGLKEGQTGTGSDGKKYVVKGGVWVSQ